MADNLSSGWERLIKKSVLGIHIPYFLRGVMELPGVSQHGRRSRSRPLTSRQAQTLGEKLMDLTERGLVCMVLVRDHSPHLQMDDVGLLLF